MEIEGVKINFLGHSGFLIEYKGKRIAIDPYNINQNLQKVHSILITHSHYDHCSLKDIEKISKPGTLIITPVDAQSKITKIDNIDMQIIESGDELELGNVRIEAVPAYNINKKFHPKSEGWLGYLLKLGNVVIYHAGDTDKIPEMKNLTGYGKKGIHFICLLPVSGKFVMNFEEAFEAANLLNPNIAIPMHYGAGVAGTIEDAKKFVELCDKNNIKAVILDKL